MSGACSLASGPPSLARDLLGSVDCFIADKVEASFAGLMAPGGSLEAALTISLTLYVAIYGYRLALGLASLSLGEIVPHFIRIGLVLSLATNWPAYDRLVFKLLFDGPQQVAALVMPGASAGTGDAVIVGEQQLFDAITDYAGAAWQQRDPAAPVADAAATLPSPTPPPAAGAPPPTAPAPTAIVGFVPGAPQFVAMVLWLSALLMMASSVGLLLIVRIILALLLVVGPLFIAFGLFGATRGLSEGWLRAAVKFALVPLIVLPLTGVLVTVLTPFVASLPPGPITAFRDTPALAILMIVVVFAVVLSQALALAGIIAAGLRLPRGAQAPLRTTAETALTVPRMSAPEQSRTETIVNLVQTAPLAGAAAQPRDLLVSRAAEPAALSAIDPVAVAGRLGQGRRRITPRAGFANGGQGMVKWT
ncbi:type IV secretion system protein [Sandarakinorhabdus limnophila]|uniref:type IV secretion system protein n=1 Tax=Sandarakinorhabdus limnophila TaxID=210512 RepID=UPI0004079464|nr:type IV secretion system protein [Sandarakinorhabdus limnophila]